MKLLLTLVLLPALVMAQAKPKKKKKFSPQLGADVAADRLHPLVELENVYPLDGVELKISAMAFQGDDLFRLRIYPGPSEQGAF